MLGLAAGAVCLAWPSCLLPCYSFRLCPLPTSLFEPAVVQYVPLGRDVTTRAQQVGQVSPKTANVTPTMRSPLPEPSVAASGAVTAGGGAGGDVSAKPAGSGGVSTANGVSS